MQGGQMLDLTRYQQAQAAQAAAAQGMRGGQQMGWRPQAGASDLMRTGDWAQQMQSNPLFRLQQMGQHQGQQQGGQQFNQLQSQMLQQQMLQQQQQQQMQQRMAQQQGHQGGQNPDTASGQRYLYSSSQTGVTTLFPFW